MADECGITPGKSQVGLDYNKAFNEVLAAANFVPCAPVFHSDINPPMPTWRRGKFVVTIDSEWFWMISPITEVNDEDSLALDSNFGHQQLARALAKLPCWEATRAVPEPLPSEVLVTVVTPLGLDAGSFVWPTSALDVLRTANQTKQGFYFAWNENNDPTKPITAHGAT